MEPIIGNEPLKDRVIYSICITWFVLCISPNPRYKIGDGWLCEMVS